MKETESKILRSKRKTYGLEIKDNGLIVRAPLYATDKQIREFMNQHRKWIDTNLHKFRERQQNLADIPALTMEEIRALADKALVVIPERVRYYAPKIGVTFAHKWNQWLKGNGDALLIRIYFAQESQNK